MSNDRPTRESMSVEEAHVTKLIREGDSHGPSPAWRGVADSHRKGGGVLEPWTRIRRGVLHRGSTAPGTIGSTPRTIETGTTGLNRVRMDTAYGECGDWRM